MESTESEEDLLSELPSDILVSILSKLDLRDAVRVGVLSRRWRCLPTQLPRLDLDIDHFLPGNASEFHDHGDDGQDLDDEEEEGVVPPAPAAVDDGEAAIGNDNHTDDAEDQEDSAVYRDVFSEAGDKMADVTTMLLASRRSAGAGLGGGGNDDDGSRRLDVGVHTTLAMRFYLRHNYLSLGRLLDDAVSSGKVRAAELTITTTRLPFMDNYEDQSYDDSKRTRRILVWYGRRFMTLFDACPAAFGALTQLTLETMRHPGRSDMLGDILTTCTMLEKLCLRLCFFGVVSEQNLWCIRHARLKDIQISTCGIIRGIKLEWLPRLERFTLHGWIFTTNNGLVSVGDVPCLTRVTLSNDFINSNRTIKLSTILANHNTALNDLRLNFKNSNIWVQPETSRCLTHVFSRLKNLKIRNVHEECGLAWTMFLLQCAPHLEQLYIKLTEHDCEESTGKNVPWEVATGFMHYSLARVTIVGFYHTEETIVAFIRQLVEAAVNLEEICMREKAPFCCVFCGQTEPPDGSRFPRTEQDKDAFTNRITDGRSAATVKIHIQS